MARHYCAVPQCKNQSDRVVRPLSWHGFPKDKRLRKLWIIAIRRDLGKNFQITVHTKVCSEHFKKADFRPFLHLKKRDLKPEAVPSVFQFSEKRHDSTESTRAQRLLKRTCNKGIERPHCVGSNQHSSDVTQEEHPVITAQEEHPVILPQEEHPPVLTQTQEEYPVVSYEEVICLDERDVDAATSLLRLQASSQQHAKTITDFCQSNKKDKGTQADEFPNLIETINHFKLKIKVLKSSHNILEYIKTSDKIFQKYTGFQSYAVFLAFYDYLKPKAERLRYWRSEAENFREQTSEKRSKQSITMNQEEELLMILIYLHLAIPRPEICRNFNISNGHVSKLLTTWINFLFYELKSMFTIPERQFIHKNLPLAFRTPEFQSTRCILDCTEFRVQTPSGLNNKRELYSNYKNHQTYKALIAICPDGLICFVSALYGGGYSDKFITEQSGVLSQLQPGDSVMVDKGFDIEDILPCGVNLIIPPKFMKKRDIQMPPEAVKKTRNISKVRVHVERAIRRIKEYLILDKVLPLNMVYLAEQIITVCAFLTNFKPPLIKQ